MGRQPKSHDRVYSLWARRPPERRYYEDTLGFVEEIERDHPSLAREAGGYQGIMTAIRGWACPERPG